MLYVPVCQISATLNDIVNPGSALLAINCTLTLDALHNGSRHEQLSQVNVVEVSGMQDLDDITGMTDEAKGSQSSSRLFANVLKGPDPISAPAPPAGPIGAGLPTAHKAIIILMCTGLDLPGRLGQKLPVVNVYLCYAAFYVVTGAAQMAISLQLRCKKGR